MPASRQYTEYIDTDVHYISPTARTALMYLTFPTAKNSTILPSRERKKKFKMINDAVEDCPASCLLKLLMFQVYNYKYIFVLVSLSSECAESSATEAKSTVGNSLHYIFCNCLDKM